MAAIRAVRPNGLKVATTFAGAGGSSLGYRMAGFEVAWANEFVPSAQESYRANASPSTVLDPRSILDVRPEDVLKATGLEVGELDLLDGSPPCQAFSSAGKGAAGWGSERVYEHGAAQRNEELFYEYVRLRDGLRPRTFVAENVSGLVKGAAKGMFVDVLRRLRAGGEYWVEARLLDAKWLGVPQARQRIIFIGVRADLGIRPAFPSPLPYQYTVRDAIPWIARAIHDTRGTFKSGGDISDRLSVTIVSNSSGHFKVEPVHMTSRDGEATDATAATIDGFAIGREWDGLSPGQQSKKFFSLVKVDPDLPSPTITATGGSNNGIAAVVHPYEKRKFSILEVKRLCSFPDDFELKGTYGQQWERLGNSVPPLMMRAVAETVRDRVLLPARERAKNNGRRIRSRGRSTSG